MTKEKTKKSIDFDKDVCIMFLYINSKSSQLEIMNSSNSWHILKNVYNFHSVSSFSSFHYTEYVNGNQASCKLILKTYFQYFYSTSQIFSVIFRPEITYFSYIFCWFDVNLISGMIWKILKTYKSKASHLK